ncbi:extracellular solute-binding protein [Thioalkalivibrio sp. ALE28]|uniref:extracellular solute-binding protein n=1 Tax=Thioalkalivibrio sp. ALE28 TaxID=1158179 RepID=UPI00047763E3|nr:extracellular solute-binding protein [Thioalkalivibrio sp. ALE28]
MGIRSLLLLAGLTVALPSLTGCTGSSSNDDTLVVYSAGPRPLIEHIVEAFEARHDVRVDLFAATTGQVMAKLEAERYRNRADVVIFASELAAEALKRDGRLRPYRPSGVEQTDADWHDPDGYFHATAAALVGVAVRKDRPLGGSGSLDWPDLMRAPHAERTVMPSPSRSGATGDFLVNFAQVQGDELWPAFIDARTDGLDFAAANSQAIGGLVTGAYDAILGVVDYLVLRQQVRNPEVEMRYPTSGAAMVRRPIVILDEAHAPGLAEAFVDFYFSEFAQEAVAEQHLIPAREGIANSPERQAAYEGMPPILALDRSQALAAQNRLLRQFQLRVERAEIPRAVRSPAP